MKKKTLHIILTYLIAAVWFVNGLVAKVLNFVPRHQEIVSSILGNEYARLFTILIGLAEVVMAIWVVSRFKSKFNAMTQIVVILTMNLLEFLIVPDLLLWGRVNSLYALIFVGVIYYNEFILGKQLKTAI